jgi:membrane fusion protein YbhG
MKSTVKLIYLAVTALLVLAIAGCSVLPAGASPALAASGIIETVEVDLSPELGGRVSTVNAQEGETVHEGDVLLQFDSALLDTQRAQAAATLAAAKANYEALRAGPTSAQGQAAIAQAEMERLQAQQALDDLKENTDLAIANAQLAVANANDTLWHSQRDVNSIEHPKIQDYQDALSDAQDALTIAETNGTINTVGPLGDAIQAAQDAVKDAQDNLGAVQTAEDGCGGCDPDRLNQAQDDLNGAKNGLQTLELQQQTGDIQVSQAVRDARDAVKHAQDHLNAALAGPNARKLAIAEAQLAVAQATLAHAQHDLEKMGDGPDPDALAAAQARLDAAEAALTAAKTGPSQEELDAVQAQVEVAQAALDAADEQIAKLTITAPVDGVVLSRSVEPGEVASPGATLFVLGRLSNLSITVYVPEDRYGEINLGQAAQVSVDSFPGETFTARVAHIADQAEFTPRNVQTASGRKTTVFAVKLAIENPDGRLKPGMPADVNFGSNS